MTARAPQHNMFEDAARAIKVRQLVSAVEAAFAIVDTGATPDQRAQAIEDLNDAQWAQLETLARVKNPASETTRAMVIQTLKGVAETWERARLERRNGEREP
jgi:hypothetical protein